MKTETEPRLTLNDKRVLVAERAKVKLEKALKNGDWGAIDKMIPTAARLAGVMAWAEGLLVGEAFPVHDPNVQDLALSLWAASKHEFNEKLRARCFKLMLDSDSEAVRFRAAHALAVHDDARAEVMKTLTEATNSNDPDVARAALSLGKQPGKGTLT